MVKFKGTAAVNRQSSDKFEHMPVMLNEVLHAMSPRAGAIYVDATFGLGGYTRALLEKANCRVIAFDQDPDASPIADQFKQEFKERFDFILSPFDKLEACLVDLSIARVDGVVFDLGVSSPQLDRAERGFSFSLEGPLDMRMSKKGMMASDVVNQFTQEDIADVLWQYGEEKKSRLIAKKIVERRDHTPFQTTRELAELIASVFPRKQEKIHPATRSFQALRIYVNRELDQLKAALAQSLSVLNHLGRLVVVSFHSLEDRIVKTFFREMLAQQPNASRYMPLKDLEQRSIYFSSPEKLMKPSIEEIAVNPRSRSARLRWGLLHKPEAKEHVS